MFLFILPYSKTQYRMKVKDCHTVDYSLQELEPLSRALEKHFCQNNSLAPLYRRFGGFFWENLELWVAPPKVMDYIRENSYVLSPVYGLVKPDACLPYAPVGWNEVYQGNTLFEFWKVHLRDIWHKLLSGRTVVPFMPERYYPLLDLSEAQRVVKFVYYRKDQKVKNPLRHYAYTLRYIAEKGLSLEDLHKINFYDYRVEKLEERGRNLILTMRSEGRYEL
ncbi:MAG: peroxide stress protein YaaA [Aquificaceae bacterium]|nr:peroxide stress protein YaaA [Aquificaceae bacterium]MDW8423410.1 peroxide stress protein YaaA [Aquificaceae bacterium]